MEHDHTVTFFGVEYGVNFCAGIEDGMMDEHTEISVRRIVDHDAMLTAAHEEPHFPVYRGMTDHEIARGLLYRNRRLIESQCRR
jgi:hypothetical protein